MTVKLVEERDVEVLKTFWLQVVLRGVRGKIDCILRLLETKEITRENARELIDFAYGLLKLDKNNLDNLPYVPVFKLDWSGEPNPPGFESGFITVFIPNPDQDKK